MTYPGINLPSEDLKSKFGFHDGDILYSYCDQHDLDDLWKNVGVKDVLCLLVERHLLPLLPGVRTYRICSIHNPIRAEDGCEVPANIVAHVTHEQVVAAIEALQPAVQDATPKRTYAEVADALRKERIERELIEGARHG
mgnify:FL=1